jgi:hypothetical protein
MPTIGQLKEQEAAPAPILLFDCTLRTGRVERWSTHAITFESNDYAARLLKHNLFELRASSDDGLDSAAKISLTLANADSLYSQIERETGFKGSQLTIRLIFFDFGANAPVSEARVLFRGAGNTADEITESTLRVTFSNRFNLQRIVLPDVRIQRRCPWAFPSTAAQRQEALSGGAKGPYSALYRCGYSSDQTGGAGTTNGGAPFTSCDYTRANCEARGMFDKDSSNQITRRFGGVEFVPAQIQVRSFGEGGTHLSPVIDNQARYNDFVPLVYGSQWYKPPIVFARNDGNLTRMEVLLGMGEFDAVVRVLVNGIEIPQGISGADMTATGWYNVVSPGTRSGAFNADFTDSSGTPLGDPYGSMAFASVVVPNRISNGQTLPKIELFARGMKLESFNSSGVSQGFAYTNNPAWVVLDILRRSGWLTSEIDLSSFADTAAYCAQSLIIKDLYGNDAAIARFECGLVVNTRTSVAELLRGIRTASSLMLTYNSAGLLTLRVENSISLQQPNKPAGTNSADELDGGWPAYEFSDGSGQFSGILRKPNGAPAIRLYSRSGADVPNRLTVEFQDVFNDNQQDSLSLIDVDDSLLTGREVTTGSGALGLTNFDQATRALQLQLDKLIHGNTFVEFETTVRGVDLLPGDIIALTYLKEGFERQPFRIVRLAPGQNYETVLITAQWHDDAWYNSGTADAAGGRRAGGIEWGLPRPLVGAVLDSGGVEQFGVTETVTPLGDGSMSVVLGVEFGTPVVAGSSAAQIPLVGLNPSIATTGGTLNGGQTYYYALTSLDSTGAETALSFTIAATIPAGTNTNAVTLNGLSFSPGTSSMDVYRGANPYQLLRIAPNVATAATFVDSGLTPALDGPPDANYDHANFYWRMELQPEVAANIHTPTTIGSDTLGMLADDFKGAFVRITSGTGAKQERAVMTNNATTLTITPPWTIPPDATSKFVVTDGTWKFGGVVWQSPAAITVPDRPGATVEISGRSANVHDLESDPNLNPLTRWQIGGGNGGSADSDTPPMPVFGLNPAGQGNLELLGIGFTTFTNTRTITAGTLYLSYWDELSSPTTFTLATGIDAAATTITLNANGSGTEGYLVQIEGEILQISAVSGGGSTYTVQRGSHGSTASSHAVGTLVYHLKRSATIVPFVKGFFGSQASGAYVHQIFLPNVRVGAADFSVTNAFGESPTGKAAFSGLADSGIRTMSGGQLSIQVEGFLATQTDAAPPLVVEDPHAARDMFAVVRQAPSGGNVQLTLRIGTTPYASLTIPDGALVSNTVSGFGLAALASGSRLALDITSVPTASGSLPGRDLTVTIRL